MLAGAQINERFKGMYDAYWTYPDISARALDKSNLSASQSLTSLLASLQSSAFAIVVPKFLRTIPKGECKIFSEFNSLGEISLLNLSLNKTVGTSKRDRLWFDE